VICAARRATPILVVCTCADFTEVRRRFRACEGHEKDPEREASDLSDQLSDGTRPAILIYDTVNGGVARIRRGVPALPSLVTGETHGQRR